MAFDTLKGGIPLYDLDTGYSIVFDAIDPTTGATVSGVVVSQVAIYGNGETTTAGAGPEPPKLAAGLLPG